MPPKEQNSKKGNSPTKPTTNRTTRSTSTTNPSNTTPRTTRSQSGANPTPGSARSASTSNIPRPSGPLALQIAQQGQSQAVARVPPPRQVTSVNLELLGNNQIRVLGHTYASPEALVDDWAANLDDAQLQESIRSLETAFSEDEFQKGMVLMAMMDRFQQNHSSRLTNLSQATSQSIQKLVQRANKTRTSNDRRNRIVGELQTFFGAEWYAFYWASVMRMPKMADLVNAAVKSIKNEIDCMNWQRRVHSAYAWRLLNPGKGRSADPYLQPVDIDNAVLQGESSTRSDFKQLPNGALPTAA